MEAPKQSEEPEAILVTYDGEVIGTAQNVRLDRRAIMADVELRTALYGDGSGKPSKIVPKPRPNLTPRPRTPEPTIEERLDRIFGK